ncbi:MAG: YbaK/EbsC family protein [Oenococcus sp.]|uniref:YbaK/EbsC family protein n=1 Tax=Oenococcus sp. TaxID=1979414 RepID=UPI0039E77478
MSVAKVADYFQQYGLADRIHVFQKLTATVQEAAETLGIQADQIAKTLAFDLDGSPLVVVTSGLTRVSNQKFKASFGKRPTMIANEKLEQIVGYVAGAVCPFALNSGVRVYLDRSLEKHDLYYPAAGDVNAAIRLSLQELEKYSHPAAWVDVAK